MWVRARQAEAGIGKHIPKIPRDAGFPHSDDPERKVKGELWVGVTLSGLSPVIWIPMKRGPEGCEAKGGGLDIKQHQAL